MYEMALRDRPFIHFVTETDFKSLNIIYNKEFDEYVRVSTLIHTTSREKNYKKVS